MSTKIYNAYRLKGSIHELMDLFKTLRKYHQEYIIQVYKKFSKIFPEKDFKGIIEKDETLQSLAENIFGEFALEGIIKKIADKGINEPLNVEASAVVYFYEEKIYVVFFGLPRQVMNLLPGSPILEDYHYQNSVDQSNYDWEKEKWENMSPERQEELEKDWDERRKIWDILVGDGAFYENGLIFNFVPSGYPMTLLCKEILKPFKPTTNTPEDV